MAEEIASHEYRYVGSHADLLANGRPVEPGEFVQLTDEEVGENQEFVDVGKLLLIEGKAAGRRHVASSKKHEDGEES